MPEIEPEDRSRPLNTNGGEVLFRQTMERFLRALSANRGRALDQFGFTLYHSLPVDRRARLVDDFKFEGETATSHYNLGVLAANDQNFEQAAKLFKSAWDNDPSLREALFNLALAKERLGKTDEARSLFEQYIEVAESSDERGDEITKVRSHLKELETAAQ